MSEYPPPPPPAPPPTDPYGNIPAGHYFDPVSGMVLPNGTQLASAERRIWSFFLAIPLAIVTLFIGYVIWGLIVWSRGQTPTQQVLGMRCWRPQTGQVATWDTMALRGIVGPVAEHFLGPITWIVSFVMFLMTPQRKALHDLIAGTVVLSDPGKVLG